MTRSFITCVITSPLPLAGEVDAIIRLLETGAADFVHIRKPDYTEEQTRKLIESIPESYHHRLRLHDHFRLLAEYSLGGAHLNSRNPVAPEYAHSISRSCHSLEEVTRWSDAAEYVTLSPVFDSISKPGYESRFSPSRIKGKIPASNVIALGGVMPQSFQQLHDAGFAGAAMLGCVWSHLPDLESTISTIINQKTQI